MTETSGDRSGNLSWTLLFLLIHLSGYSQEIIGRYNGLAAAHYDPATRLHTQVFQDSIRILDMVSGRVTAQPVHGIGGMTKEFNLIRQSDRLYLVNKFGGLVYRVSGDSLQRIDRSYQHLMQSYSLDFVHNDTIYRHGGYGLWSARRELVYFDPNIHEWEVVKPLKSAQAPHGLYQHIGMMDRDRLIVLAGLFIEINDPTDFKTNQEVWSFDFNQKEWTKLGELSAHAAQRAFDGYPGIPSENKLLVFSKDINVYDFSQNRLQTYEANPLQSFVVEDIDIRSFYDGGHYYLYRHLNSRVQLPDTRQILELVRMRESDLLRKEMRSEKLILSSASPISLWLASIPILLVAGLFIHWRRRNKQTSAEYPQLTSEGISHGIKNLNLNAAELEIIKVLLSAESEITTNQILEITQNPNLDYTHNLRMKNQMIEKLNVGLRTLLNINEDVITSQRSSVDRRIRTYAIRKEYFQPTSGKSARPKPQTPA